MGITLKGKARGELPDPEPSYEIEWLINDLMDFRGMTHAQAIEELKWQPRGP